MKTNVACNGSLGLAPLVVYALGFSLAGVPGAFAQSGATTIQYRQGVFPNGSYSHLGSELRQTSPNNNWGGSDLIRSGNSSGNFLRTVLGFDLTGITSDMVITSVSLQMHVNSQAGLGAVVEAHRLTNSISMIEGTGNDAVHPTGVTWNRIQNNGSSDILWANAGGDFDSTVLSSVSATSGDGVFYTFASSPAFVAAAQDALVSDGGLLEFILYSPNAEAVFAENFVRWDSDDASESTFRPLLSVSYVPEPTAAALAGLGGLWLLRVRRR
jgi:hypothetical protein